MWSLAASLLTWVLGLFGFGKPDPFKQGQALGRAETTAADSMGELRDIKAASDARAAVSDDVDSLLNDHANRGPARGV